MVYYGLPFYQGEFSHHVLSVLHRLWIHSPEQNEVVNEVLFKSLFPNTVFKIHLVSKINPSKF